MAEEQMAEQAHRTTAQAATPASTGPEFKEGDSVRIQHGERAGTRGTVVRVLASQATARGKSSYYAYKLDSSSEHYRAQDLARS